MKKLWFMDAKYCSMMISYYGLAIAMGGYASVYMLAQGFSNSTIGISLALINILSILVQSTLSTYCDRHQEIDLRHVIMIIAAVVVILGVVIQFCGSGSPTMLCVFICVYTVHQTISPILNSLAFIFEKHGISINFGLGRGMGSAAYASVSLLLGFIAERYGIDWLPIVYIIFSLLLIVAARFYQLPKSGIYDITNEKASSTNMDDMENDSSMKENGEKDHSELSFVGFILKYKKFSIFCLGTSMLFFTHIILTNYTIQVIRPIGGTESMMGTAVFIACIMELPAMALNDRLRNIFGTRNVMLFSAVCFLIKHTLSLLAPNIWIFYLAQMMQFFGYGTFFPASVYYGNQSVDRTDRVKAQTMILFSYTFSSIFATLIGGVLLDIASVKTLLMLGVVLSVAGLIVCTLSSQKVSSESEE